MLHFLAALLLALLPAGSHVDPAPDLRTAALGAGLPASYEVVRIVADDVNGFHFGGGLLCVLWGCFEAPPTVGVIAPADWPQEWVLAILFHEVGHAVLGHDPDTHAGALDEWEADRYSAAELCRLGYNGPALNAEALTQVLLRSPEGVWAGSPSHGSLVARIRDIGDRTCSGEAPPQQS